MQPKSSNVLIFFLSFLITILGISIHFLLSPHFSLLPFILAYPVIYLISSLLGFWPSILSVIMWTMSISYFYFSPIYSFHIIDSVEVIHLLTFDISSIFVSFMVHQARVKRKKQTLELIENKLREAEAREKSSRLENVNLLKDQFVNTLTHDLRTPLSIARLSTELILSKCNDEEKVIKFANKSLISLERIDMMLMDLLDSRSISAGNPLSMNMEEFDLAELIHEVRDDFNLLNGDRLVIQIENDCKVRWCRKYIKRALENLLSNALKYGAASEPIKLGFERIGNKVDLWVINQGNVISAEDIDRIFTPFLRISAGENTKEGWGIGLTLIKGVVSGHNGNLTVSSDEIKGTRFCMTLPVSP